MTEKINEFINSKQNTVPEGIFQLNNKSSLLREVLHKEVLQLSNFASDHM